ncbi:hypothetical protein ABEB36_002120 [Hypothenemus hampei]|uniref:Autophagy-related protein 2 n=1 Tax=Hypothenemus hampei TaxID=57062 RepID=A0ABD1F4N9_HYPHA
MSWFQNLIPETIKKSVCSCLIKRYLSEFIENEITRDQLNLDLYNGRATAERISLAVEALNKLGESQNWPIEFVDGYIEKIHITVPWTAIFKESTQVEICGLKLTVQPKQQVEDAKSMFESMWNSMTSSMHLAEQYTEEVAAKKDSNTPAFEGIELFAETIDTVVRKIRVKFVDAVIQIEHLPKEAQKGVGLIMNIDFMEYYDDFCVENNAKQDTIDPSTDDPEKAYLVDAITTKNVVIKGIALSTVEFSSDERTVSRSLISENIAEPEEAFAEAIPLQQQGGSDELLDEEQRHVILCGKCFGNQEVKIRLKQSANLSGPKVAIEVNLGSLVLFLSPRQFHILMELMEGFSSPDLEDNSNVMHRNQPQPRPMTERDYQIVEEQLAQMTSPRNLQGLNLAYSHGWSTGYLDDDDDQYIPMRATDTTMYDSAMSGFSSSLESSVVSNISATDITRRRVTNIDSDPTAEISHFQVRIASVTAILLQADILPASALRSVYIRQMQSYAEKFFVNISGETFSGLVTDGFDALHTVLNASCSDLNHLRILASPLKVEGNETTIHKAFSISGFLTSSKLELSECLYTTECKLFPLIRFEVDPNTTSYSNPNLYLKFKHVQQMHNRGTERKRGPKTELFMVLDRCTVDFDVSIIDRLTSVLYYPKICTTLLNETGIYANKPVSSSIPTTAKKFMRDLKVSCPLLNFKLRFPIPDLRPATDMSKSFWFERNVRPDFMVLALHDITFRTIFQSGKDFNEYNIDARLLDIYYYENEYSSGSHVARSQKEEMGEENNQNIRLSIKMYPQKLDEEQEEFLVDPMTHSCYGVFENQNNPEPGPFGKKRVVHESDTPHQNIKKDDSEEQVIPGDKPEMESFIASTTSNVELLVEVYMAEVSILIASKHVYELIYNRLNNDLFLWEPQAPRPAGNKMSTYGNIDDQYIVANTGRQYDSDSGSSEDDEPPAVFHSAYDSKYKHNQETVATKKGSSRFALSLNIDQGIVSLHPPLRDTLGNIIPEQTGELLLNIIQTNVFIVNGYKGDSDLGYVCVQVKDAQLYHCDIQSEQSKTLRTLGAISDHLFPTIYHSDKKCFPCNMPSKCTADREIFTAAVKIQANHDTHHVKVVTVSIGLNQATLRHKMVQHSNSWIAHLIDYFNVQDYPITGYLPKDVLTEMHLHMWDCAVDYRPLNLPLRSLITVGNFSISSHLTAVANTSTLTMMFEDCGLFLSDKGPPRNGVPSNVKVDLRKDYVNVMEVTLFEISIKTSDKRNTSSPHIDLRASINKLFIRTCSDSGRALFQLLTYYINDGDLSPEPQDNESTNSSPHRNMEEELLALERSTETLSQNQQDYVNQMLEDAMKESPKSSKTQLSRPVGAGAKLFYFPGEKEALDELPGQTIPSVTTDLGPINMFHFGGKEQKKDEDDYYMVDKMSLDEEKPEITWFSQEMLLEENNFVRPDSKRDILAHPRNFPMPVSRYVLREMSITWEMYGGNDFQQKEKKIKKEVTFSEDKLSESVSFSNTKQSNQITFNKAGKSSHNESWIKKGGENRDHTVLMELELTKVKISHEVYPEITPQASRQVLSISDITIRDKLQSSQLNKFLYQYSSQPLPRQARSDMVVVKALHSRRDPHLNRKECDLKISLLPIRLNIDQDSLFFLIGFFKELNGEPQKSDEAKEESSTAVHHEPIMTTSLDENVITEREAKEAVAENLILLESRYHVDSEEKNTSSASTTNVTDDSPIYFRLIEFSRDVLIRLDYVGKRVDLRQGSLTGLLMGLTYLKCSEIRLKRIVHPYGILGFNKLVAFLVDHWLTDIKKNQLSNILTGVGPMKAVIQLFQGLKDLFWLPIEQYQKDGRIVRGLQRGANSFTTSTAMAALELTSRLIYFIQMTAETAYDMLSPGPSLRTRRLAKRKGRKKRYQQPQDIREGLMNACMVVKEGIGETADNIIQVAASEREQKGISGAVGAVIRQIPPTTIKPVIIALDATNNVLGGMQSQLRPDVRREENEKWLEDL